MMPVRITVRCKIVTPMLSSGANTQKFEIRSSAIKSSLRFWWRAFQPLEGKELYKKEAKLFGSMDICCPFSIILMPDDNTFQYWRPGNSVDNELDHAWGEGVGYVFFPIYASARPKQRQPARIKPPDQKKPSKSGRTVAKPGGRFKIHINFISRESTPSQVGDVLCSLWLIENFGGLGGRTRRGAGCFKIEATDMEKNIDIGEVPDFYQSSFANAREYIASGLKVIFSRWFKGKIPSSLPTHTAFRHGHSQIMIFSGLRNRNYLTGIGAIRAMDAIGQRMRDFRHTNPHDEAEAMHHALTGEGRAKPDIKVLQKAQLGLPIRYNFRGCDEFGTRGRPEYPGGYETKGGVVYDERTNEAKIDDKKNVDRRASPLLISCHEFKGTPYAIACHFPAPILPKGQRIWLKAGYNAKDCYPKAPVKYDYVDKLLIKGDVVNGKQRKPLCTAFDDHWPVYDRTGEVFFETTEPEPKTPDTLATTQSTSKTKADIDPKEIKRIYLLQAPKQKHGLSWFLAEISGPSIGKNPKRQWPCDLWYLEGENLKREIITWYVRPKQLDSARDVKREQGALFLCTKEPDSNTKGNNMFLYNVTKPVLSNDSAK